MSVQINPIARAELELRAAFPGASAADFTTMMGIIHRTVELERLTMGEHADCGVDNPEGTAGLCKCYCHKGHYKHVWVPVITSPKLNEDGTYHLLDRCKYCADMRVKIIGPKFIKEQHTLVSLEYLVRGEQRVLTKEEWLSRKPAAAEWKFLREEKL